MLGSAARSFMGGVADAASSSLTLVGKISSSGSLDAISRTPCGDGQFDLTMVLPAHLGVSNATH
ncbi:hypothetical protein [Edaphobacter modestus]|uniref:hypothetical protein n=1 Tax=Edaphobacter modestus TaxID=388466 RepID=UPI00102B3CEF|nr:hypothetical protein [Edaphobacter modestus]